MPQQWAARGGGLDPGSWLSVWLQLLSRLGSPSLVTSAGTMGAQGTEGADCKHQSKAPPLQFSTHPSPSTLPASTLTAVTRHQGQVWPEGVIGHHTRSLLSSPPSPRRNKGGTRLLLCARRCGPLHIQLQWAHLLPIELPRAN